MKLIISCLLLVLVLVLVLVPGSLSAQDEPRWILAGKLLDVESGSLRTNVLLRVEQGILREITEGADRSTVKNLIDLSNYTVLPGLIDAHTHLCDNTYMGDAFDHWSYPAATFGIVGTVNARRTLEAGFTTVRDVSAPFYADIALRDAIRNGWIVGPRMYVSGSMITVTGGHGAWGNWIAPQHKVTTDAHSIADGPDAVRRAVRAHIEHGVDQIKLAATGGFGTHGTIPGAASYTVEEMRAAVEEARKRGIRVAAHAHGAEGIKNAVLAGVHSIEHGSLLDREAIDLIKERGVFLVMDLLAAHYDLIEKNLDFTDKELGHSNQEEYAQYRRRFREAYEAGVRMAFGTDAGVYPHGRNAEQFQLMVDSGMTPLDAVRSATLWAAELLGIQDQAGTLEVGKWADLIAVESNPLEDVSALDNVRFVMKGGEVYKAEKVPGNRRE